MNQANTKLIPRPWTGTFPEAAGRADPSCCINTGFGEKKGEGEKSGPMAVNRGNYFTSRETKFTICEHGTGLESVPQD